MKKQAMNPFLPLDEYIPDGEPHVFGDRIYLFGSHDTEGGTRYCSEENYLVYSAPLSDLSDWRCDGVIFEARQDPNYVEGAENDLYAPDVVRGNDGRYYLYYNMTGNVEKTGFHDLLHVAVCDSPAGRYEYYGFVKNPDGTPYRSYLDADPAVISDGGVIRLYHGWSLSMVAAAAHQAGQKAGAPGAAGEDPGQAASGQGQASGQAASAPAQMDPTSPEMKAGMAMLHKMLFNRTPEDTKDLEYPLMGANTVELEDDMLTVRGKVHRIVPGQFDTPKDSSFFGHAFYGAASIRKIAADGSIVQVECTSCGLNGKPLQAKGSYPAPYACNITNGHMPHATNTVVNAGIPFVNHKDGERFIDNIKEGTMIGFKYFAFEGPCSLSVKTRGAGKGIFWISTDEAGEKRLGEIAVSPSVQWKTEKVQIAADEKQALYLHYEGTQSMELLEIILE